jgi:hypothetical protein
MMPDNVSVIKPGVIIEGDNGASRGAVIIANKQADNFTDVVLCLASESPHHPYVVWTYRHDNGRCFDGNYFKTLDEAMARYIEREY